MSALTERIAEVLALRDRHRKEPWPNGTGSNCAECNGRRFPCPTRQVLDRLAAVPQEDT
jgi:hypothetical protein